MNKENIFFAHSAVQQQHIAQQFADVCKQGLIIYLAGNLGAGKTTFVQGFIHQLGYQGRIKSPTYSLIESYKTPQCDCYHLDLYRLADAEELEYTGFRDLLTPDAIFLIEWADKGAGVLPLADIVIEITYQRHGRDIYFNAQTDKGRAVVHQLLDITFNNKTTH